MYSPNSTSPTSGCGAYPGAGGQNDAGNTIVSADANMLLNDHRASGNAGYNTYPGSGSFTGFVAAGGPMMNGTCYTHGGSGTTCPILPGGKESVTEFAFIGSQPATSAVVTNWQSNFTSNGWGTLGHLPLINKPIDEPSGASSFASLVSLASSYHGYAATGVPIATTTDYNSLVTYSATNAVDYLITEQVVIEYSGSGSPNVPPTSWLSGSVDNIPRQFWTYSDCEEASTCTNGVVGNLGRTHPNRHIDGKPAANRAQEWNTFHWARAGSCITTQTSVSLRNPIQPANAAIPHILTIRGNPFIILAHGAMERLSMRAATLRVKTIMWEQSRFPLSCRAYD